MEMKQIDSYEKYFICTDGSVYSEKRNIYLKTTANKLGYVQVSLCDKKHKTFNVHRLVALAFIPNPNNYSDIDHINRNKADNRVENLRWVTRQINMLNIAERENKTSKFRGVYKSENKWKAQITRNRKVKGLGTFDNEIEAAEAYNKAAAEYAMKHLN